MTGELHSQLVDQLAGSDGRRLLAELARGNSAIERTPGAPGGVRIHPLIRNLLTAQLRVEQPSTAAALHWMCATWYADPDQSAETDTDAAADGGGATGSHRRRVARAPG